MSYVRGTVVPRAVEQRSTGERLAKKWRRPHIGGYFLGGYLGLLDPGRGPSRGTVADVKTDGDGRATEVLLAFGPDHRVWVNVDDTIL